ncbi:Ankyrin repeat domain-containing protein 53 [Pleurostoma richardsiae]|uniref:Ankyrin repeat domain-containing protein 53 n=1 Tax=Pleurostoma richardsiae TaxID=41990 RepID=A0AA38RA25_9PEZI|nr:Ankyrin repeat domain-containing protein 53 [Pleurostoma richardsiae]
MALNQYLLAADNSPTLLPLLRSDPPLARQQDEHGYSLVHAAASYNHLDLLRALVNEFRVPVDLRDEDSESPLFVVETVDAARVLVEELGADIAITGQSGQTAREKIEEEGDFPDVAEYLKSKEVSAVANGGLEPINASASVSLSAVPEGLAVTVGTIDSGDASDDQPDPELRRRIEELAARDDFNTAVGQAELRRLVEDFISMQDMTGQRQVRPRQN